MDFNSTVMIYRNNKGMVGVYKQKTPIVAIYINGHEVWALNVLFSCFSAGYWLDDYPWTDDTPWTD